MANKSYINFQSGVQNLDKAIDDIAFKEKNLSTEPKRSGPPLPPPRNLSSRSSYSIPVVNTLVTGNSTEPSFKSNRDDSSAPTGVATRYSHLTGNIEKNAENQDISRINFPNAEKIPSVLSKRSELTDLLMKLLMRRIFLFQSNSNNRSQNTPQNKNQNLNNGDINAKKNSANDDAIRLMQYLVLIIFAEDHQAFSIEGYPSALRVHFGRDKIDEPSQGEATSEDNVPMFHYELNKFPGPYCHFDKQGIPQCTSDEDNNFHSTSKPTIVCRGDNSESDEDEEILDNLVGNHEKINQIGVKEDNINVRNYPNDYMALPEGTTMKQLKSSALQALYGLVMASQIDPSIRQRDLHIVRLLAKIHQYYNLLASKLIHAIQENIPLVRVILQMNEKSPFDEIDEDNSNQSPLAELAALVRLSFQPEVRQVISDLGGVYALINLLRWEHALWTEFIHQSGTNPVLMKDTYQHLQQSIVLRRYICMALTNLTFGSAENKAIVCKRRLCLESLVSQLEIDNEDLKQVAASVLRNLSWKTTLMIRQSLRKTHASKRLMRAVLIAQRDSTIKNMLSALWNLSSHSNSNKKSICSVDGFLEFFLRTIQRQFEILKSSNDSSLLLVIESCAGILRNLSPIIASNEYHRINFTELNGYAIMIDQLSSHSSLTVLVNMINFLHTLTQVNAWPYLDTREMKQLISCRALQVLKEISLNSHHKALVQTAEAVCNNLIAWSPNVQYSMENQPENRLVEDNKSQHLSSAEVVYRRRMNNRSRNPRIGYLSVVFETDSDYYHSSTDDDEVETSEDENITPDDEDSGIPCEGSGTKQNEMMLTKNHTQDHSIDEKIQIYATEGSPCANGSLLSSSLNSEEEESDGNKENNDEWQAKESAEGNDFKPSDSALESPLIFSRGASSLNSSMIDTDNLPPIQSNIQTSYSNSLTACTSAQLSYSVSRPPELNDENNMDYEADKKEDDLNDNASMELLDGHDKISEEKLLTQVIESAMPKESTSVEKSKISDNERVNYHLNHEESDSSTTNSSNSECDFSNTRPRIAVAPMPQTKGNSSIIDSVSYSSDESSINPKKSSQNNNHYDNISELSSSNSTNKNLINECISLAMPSSETNCIAEKDSFLDRGLEKARPPDTSLRDIKGQGEELLPEESSKLVMSMLKRKKKLVVIPQDQVPLADLEDKALNHLSVFPYLSTPQSQTSVVTMNSKEKIILEEKVQSEESSGRPCLKIQQKPNSLERKPEDSLTSEDLTSNKNDIPKILNRIPITTTLVKDPEDDVDGTPLPPPPTRPISVIDYEEVEKEIEEEFTDRERTPTKEPLEQASDIPQSIEIKKRRKLTSENSLPLPPSPNEFELAILEQYRLSQNSLNSQLITSSSSNATSTTIYDNASPNPFCVKNDEQFTETKSEEKCDEITQNKIEIEGKKPCIVKQIVSPRSRNFTKLPTPTKIPEKSLKLPSKIAQIPKTTGLSEPKTIRIPEKKVISESTPSSRSSSIQAKQRSETGITRLPTSRTITNLKSPKPVNQPTATIQKKVAQSLPTSPKSSGYATRRVSETTTALPTKPVSRLPNISSINTNEPKSATQISSLKPPPTATPTIKAKAITSPVKRLTKPIESHSKIIRPITPSKYNSNNKPENIEKKDENQTCLVKPGTKIQNPSVVEKTPQTEPIKGKSNLKKPSTGLKLPSKTRIPSVLPKNQSQNLWISRQELKQN